MAAILTFFVIFWAQWVNNTQIKQYLQAMTNEKSRWWIILTLQITLQCIGSLKSIGFIYHYEYQISSLTKYICYIS